MTLMLIDMAQETPVKIHKKLILLTENFLEYLVAMKLKLVINLLAQ